MEVTCVVKSSTRNNSKNSAKSIPHILKIYDEDDRKVKPSNKDTDIGGGVTRDNISEELENQERAED